MWNGGRHAMKRSIRWGVAFAALLAVSCGGSSQEQQTAQAQSGCEGIVDAFAKAWERCGRESYQNARDFWSEALDCQSVTSADSVRVDQCVSALDAQACSAVESNTQPDACTGALGG
jgi:hypothetical protein